MGEGYDQGCWDLAEDFLFDSPAWPHEGEKQHELCDELAKQIRQTIERFLNHIEGSDAEA